MMDWTSLLSQDRLGYDKTVERVLKGRTEFEVDVSKITFSGSFRRLSRKTQVHPLVLNDHVHTRLTHSLEVARVGKILGNELGIRINNKLPSTISPDDIGTVLEAACLAHDIGNPPFGHAGERALSYWFEKNAHEIFDGIERKHREDLKIFEGNAQGFRILTQIENHLFDGGLRLTYATLATFLKYPWLSSSKGDGLKFGAFLSEKEIIKEVATNTGLIKKNDGKWCRHPLAYLLEAADDICYGIIDIEDAIELKLVNFNEYKDICFKYLSADIQKSIENDLATESEYRVNLARMRGAVFDFLVDAAVSGFIDSYTEIMSGKFDSNILANESAKQAYNFIKEVKLLSKDKSFTNAKKVEIEVGCYATMETLLSGLSKAALNKAKVLKSNNETSALEDKAVVMMRLLGDHAPSHQNVPAGLNGWDEYSCVRRVLDYVSGMTDNYASHIAQQVQGIGAIGIQRQ